MSGYLTTHVLDTAQGCPASGMQIELYRIDGKQRMQSCSVMTNADGRTNSPVLSEEDFTTGVYELVFYAGPYFNAAGLAFDGLTKADAGFFDVIPIRFGMSMPRHYHVPLLLSPFGYSTYRGS